MLIWMVRALAAWVVAMTLLPLVRRDAWWIRACDFPRVQVLLAGVLTLGALALVEPSSAQKGVWGVLVAVSVVHQAVRILPFTPLWLRKDSVAGKRVEGKTLSVLVSNVLMTNRDAEPLLAAVRDLRPDLVLLVEIDDWWQRALEPLNGSHPHRVGHPRDDTYGMLLASTLPLEEETVRFLVDEGIPSIRCSVVLDGGRVTFYGLHPKPPAPQEASKTTRRDAELLLVAREVGEGSGATVVAGDLNDVAWSYTTRLFRKISGLLDPRIGRGLFATFPAARAWMRFPLDHVFHSRELRLVEVRLGPEVGSDHLPIYAEFRLDSEASAGNAREACGDDAREVEDEELELVEEKIERGLHDTEE